MKQERIRCCLCSLRVEKSALPICTERYRHLRCNAVYQHIIHRTGKCRALHFALHTPDSIAQVQNTAIAFLFGRCGYESKIQISGSLINSSLSGIPRASLNSQFFCCTYIAGKHQLTNFGNAAQCIRIASIFSNTGPYTLLIELYMFGISSPEKHRAEPSVSDRIGLVPITRRCVIKQFAWFHFFLLRISVATHYIRRTSRCQECLTTSVKRTYNT